MNNLPWEEILSKHVDNRLILTPQIHIILFYSFDVGISVVFENQTFFFSFAPFLKVDDLSLQ